MPGNSWSRAAAVLACALATAPLIAASPAPEPPRPTPTHSAPAPTHRAPSAAVIDRIAHNPPAQRTTTLSAPLLAMPSTVYNESSHDAELLGTSPPTGGWIVAPPAAGTVIPPGGTFHFSFNEYVYQPSVGVVQVSLGGDHIWAPTVFGTFFTHPQYAECYAVDDSHDFTCTISQQGFGYAFFLLSD